MESWQPEEDPQPEFTIGRAIRDSDMRVAETPLRVVDQTQPILTERMADSSTRDASGLARFATQRWSLPTFSQTYATHQGAGTAVPAPVARALRSLEGKFTIVNRRCTVTLPPALQSLVENPTAQAEGMQQARWIAFALHEPETVLIRHSRSARAASGHAARDVEFHAVVPYRLTMFLGEGPSDGADTLMTEAASRLVPIEPSEGIDWFRVGLCLPDGEALRQMTEETAHFYRWITGRLGGMSRDQYWFLDAWEQYTEEGRIHGVVVPEFLRQDWLPRTQGDASETEEDAPHLESRWAPLTHTHDKRPLVPPGYCFIEFRARVSMEVRWLKGGRGSTGGSRKLTDS